MIFTQKDSGAPISNIVLMGIGEPLDNYANVLKFLTLVNHPNGMNIGMRHISLSTCGLIKGIDRLAEENLQLTLSVSLHAPDDETRSRLMPVNRATGVDALFAACRRYFQKTGRRISYEYAMIDGVNDTPRQAALLGDRLEGTVGPREPHSPELRGGEQPAPQHPRGRSSSGSWRSGASPPRCAAAWAATLTLRAASCAGKPCGSRPRASDESGERR